MPTKKTEGYQPSHDIEYTAGRRINWKNDLAVGRQRGKDCRGFLAVPGQVLVRSKVRPVSQSAGWS